LRELNQDQASMQVSTGVCVAYATLLSESKALKASWQREKREQEQAAHQRHLQDIHDHQTAYWHQVEQAVTRGSGAGYDDAIHLLIELRETANHFQASQEFQKRFSAWVLSHLRRPAFVRRLQDRRFPLPEM
jgi:hypothetical protein